MNEELQSLYDQRTAVKAAILVLTNKGAFATPTEQWQLRQHREQLKRLNQQIIISEASVQNDFLDDIPF